MSPSSHAADLSAAFADRSARIAVLGLGYAGLPLAAIFVRAGFPVIGYDIDAAKIDRLRTGRSYLGHLADDRIVDLMSTGRFEPSTDETRLTGARVFILCMPTPLNERREPDLSAVITATRAVARHLSAASLVILESTTYPGTTRNVVRPILEETGLVCGQDFFLAFSPEREDPGNAAHPTETIPRVVGGVDDTSGRLAGVLFATAVSRVVPVSSAEAAETCKLLENTYRAVNIALVNELKLLCEKMGTDVWEVIAAAKTKPFGFQAFYPGPGWGGHCIPIDPFYLAWVCRQHGVPARFVELAGEVNASMPRHVVARLTSALAAGGTTVSGSRILLLGMAYKRDVDDARESPGLVLAELLRKAGADVAYHDPHVPAVHDERHGVNLTSRPLTEELLRESAAVVIVTDHSAFDWDWIVGNARLVIDTRNATLNVRQGRERIVTA
jgi:UDP-N-acetyl-D-glucosamine dehydrogenase